ncbi:thioesterase [Acinetobacter sp. LoGeW2-3]|uniref:PaaI family thioesterase n=1 Tax=Acinetobacter sp. LoGeW2-3 TaxID=1808001 RepID=UPI000C05CDD2|nr:PaaI family thioesterase [Acinetobacter sp. LoGeW2-3]ATO18725.1 thioesterase [Acinetobacter sp. LoGeW2-3]
MTRIAFQDLYAEAYTHCYGCGRNNPHGYQLKSYWDIPSVQTIAHIRPEFHYTGGVPDHLYGGLIASLLDCHGTASAAAFKSHVLGIVFDGSENLVRCVTGSLNIQFIRPVPVNTELVLTGRLLKIEDRKIQVTLSLSANNIECAKAEMLAIQIKSP